MKTPKAVAQLVRIGARGGVLVPLCLLLSCQAPAPASDRAIANALRPLVEQGREADAQFSLSLKKLECWLEGDHAVHVAQDRDEQRLTLDEALAYVDLLSAPAIREGRASSSGAPWPDRLRAVTVTVYAHPRWTRAEAEQEVLNACLRVHGLPPLR